jgi:hypothetical protein
MKVSQIARTLILFSVCFATLPVHGQLTLIDNFDDGNDNGWTRRHFGQGTISVSSGTYRFQGNAPVPTGERGALAAFWNESTDPQYADGFVRAKVSVATNTISWIMLRASADLSEFYLFGMDPSGVPPAFFYNKIANFDVAGSQVFDVNGEMIEFGEEWIIEAGAVGDQLSMKVWKPGQPEPDLPQWTTTDGSYETGTFGLGANHWDEQPPAIVSATFDDVYFRAVPEPSTGLLTLIALIGTAIFRRNSSTHFRTR